MSSLSVPEIWYEDSRWLMRTLSGNPLLLGQDSQWISEVLSSSFRQISVHICGRKSVICICFSTSEGCCGNDGNKIEAWITSNDIIGTRYFYMLCSMLFLHLKPKKDWKSKLGGSNNYLGYVLEGGRCTQYSTELLHGVNIALCYFDPYLWHTHSSNSNH